MLAYVCATGFVDQVEKYDEQSLTKNVSCCFVSSNSAYKIEELYENIVCIVYVHATGFVDEVEKYAEQSLTNNVS